jgi:iron complex outermembrane receptor protein
MHAHPLRAHPLRAIPLIIIVLASAAHAQVDSAATSLKPVVVTVTRGTGRSVLGSAFAVTISRPDSARPGLRHTAADEMLALIPGVTAVNRNNPSQDPRLSIRGFGARSTFGVRGVRVLRDGMPITLPDGQTPLDYISLESVGTVEVLRGAASALYGNASGGIVDMRSAVPSASPLDLSARQWLGSSAFSRSIVSASGTTGATGYIGDIAYTRADGSRVHSLQRATSGFVRVVTKLKSVDLSLTGLGLNNPRAENPGALTIDEMRADPTAADPSSLRRNARKVVRQSQLGVSATRSTPATDISLSIFGGARSLDNPLTFAVVEVGRHTWGGSASLRSRRSLAGLANTVSAGIDFQAQNDLRKNFFACADTILPTTPTANCPMPGSDRGVTTLDQRELVSSAGIYASDEVSLSDRVSLVAAVRGDRVRFEVKDNLVTQSNADDSGARTLSAVSPMAGIVGRITVSQSLYANISTAFETPTATELGNHEDGTAGINPNLDPQRSYTIEWGAKGWLGSILRYDLSLFSTRVRDELVPFEIPSSNGRRYFRNAGRTKRSGVELGGEMGTSHASLMAAYTFSHFKFTDYTLGASDFSGNFIPGIPRHRLQTAARFSTSRYFAVVENEVAGRTHADDANTFQASGYSVTNARMGSEFSASLYRVGVSLGVQNLFDRVYASSLSVNAARGRYFEPAAPRSFFISLSARRTERIPTIAPR